MSDLYEVLEQSKSWSPEICEALKARGFQWFFDLREDVGIISKAQ